VEQQWRMALRSEEGWSSSDAWRFHAQLSLTFTNEPPHGAGSPKPMIEPAQIHVCVCVCVCVCHVPIHTQEARPSPKLPAPARTPRAGTNLPSGAPQTLNPKP
jgi:hypothetical protein